MSGTISREDFILQFILAKLSSGNICAFGDVKKHHINSAGEIYDLVCQHRPKVKSQPDEPFKD